MATRIAIGIMVFNEDRNLDGLLARLSEMKAPGCVIETLVIVSSGSTDQSEQIARRWVKRDARFQLIAEPERRGKAQAINAFLHQVAGVDLCVLVSGDVLPEHSALASLLAPFEDPTVGMTGARPLPSNPRRGLVNRMVHFQWALHHRVATLRPKLGEMVAFRPVLAALDPDTAVDEASLEAALTQRGYALVYAQEARVHNRGPSTLSEFLSQRQRIWTGHYRLRKKVGYEVATYRLAGICGPVWHQISHRPRDLPIAIGAAVLEGLARCLGTLDHDLRGQNAVYWRPLPSTKQPLAAP